MSLRYVLIYHRNAYRRHMQAVQRLSDRYDEAIEPAERIRLSTQIGRRIREAERHERFIEAIKQASKSADQHDRLDRKVRHGCTDFMCSECDK